ncbi:hypothetical protein J3E71DRAFT_178870, partial [Bipolaris maydis]
QSQAIATKFLSSVPDASGKPRSLDRKADFTLPFAHIPSPGFEDLYDRLRTAGNPIVSHTADAFTKTTALFSCVEVKPAGGDHTEAEYQLSVWMAASLRNKMQLAWRVGLVDKSSLVRAWCRSCPCGAAFRRVHMHWSFVRKKLNNYSLNNPGKTSPDLSIHPIVQAVQIIRPSLRSNSELALPHCNGVLGRQDSWSRLRCDGSRFGVLKSQSCLTLFLSKGHFKPQPK